MLFITSFPLFFSLFLISVTSVQFFEYYKRDIEKEGKCNEYYSYSTFPGFGRGMFAGKDYSIDDIVGDVNPAIVIPREKFMGTQLDYYEFGYDSDSSLIVLGPGSLHNHNDTYHVIHGWGDSSVEEPRDSLRTFDHSAYLFDLFQAQQEIEEGEEILFYYGEDWFTSKDFSTSETTEVEEESQVDETILLPPGLDSSSVPLPAICVSDVEVAPSSLPSYPDSELDEGYYVSPAYGVFAKRAFKQGELILAVPLLFLAAEVIESLEDHESEIVSYSLYEEGSRVYLVPMGVGAMMNHYRSLTSIMENRGNEGEGDESVRIGEDEEVMEMESESESERQSKNKNKRKRGSEEANVYLQWFDFWSHFPCATDGSGDCSFPRQNAPYALQSMLSKSVEELLEMKMAPLDMGYYAARDIEAGEELLLDYGSDWEEYMRGFLQGQAREAAGESEGEGRLREGEDEEEEDVRRQYIRHPVGLGKGSMPEHWLGHVRDHAGADDIHGDFFNTLYTVTSTVSQLFYFYIRPLFQFS